MIRSLLTLLLFAAACYWLVRAGCAPRVDRWLQRIPARFMLAAALVRVATLAAATAIVLGLLLLIASVVWSVAALGPLLVLGLFQ